MSFETLHVQKIYDIIADEFDNTRYRPWTCVESFIDDIPPYSLIGDIGCGNGKNMLYRKDLINVGCDFSKNLVNICLRKKLNVIYGNILNIPYKNNIFDYTICIAVIHHLSKEKYRKQAIKELLRVTKPNGKILILVWALEQLPTSKRKFKKQENMIKWKGKSNKNIEYRYYYVFKKNELESLIDKKYKVESFYEMGNWGVIIHKNSSDDL